MKKTLRFRVGNDAFYFSEEYKDRKQYYDAIESIKINIRTWYPRWLVKWKIDRAIKKHNKNNKGGIMKRGTLRFLDIVTFLGSVMLILFGLTLVITHWWEVGALIGGVLGVIGIFSINFWRWFFRKLRIKNFNCKTT